MSRETVISIKSRGKWRRLGSGDEEPEREHPPLPMPLRLPKPLSMDEEGTFGTCPVETSSQCAYAKMWRYIALWHETQWVRAYVLQKGVERPDLPDDEAREVAQSILEQYGINGHLVRFDEFDCQDKQHCQGALQVLGTYGYCGTCQASLMYVSTAHLAVCEQCYRNAQMSKEKP